MEIKESRYEEIILLEPIGSMDTEGSEDLERRFSSLLEEGARRFVIDFIRVDQMTGGGLRVLVMLARKLEGFDGDLVLCALNEHVTTVFEVSGLVEYFSFASSRYEAIEKASSADKPSKMSILALELLDQSEGEGHPGELVDSKRRRGGGSKLTSEVARLLSERGAKKSRPKGKKTSSGPHPKESAERKKK